MNITLEYTHTELQEFIDREIVTWGLDYIEDLWNRGYRVVRTNRGFRWILST